MILFPFLVHLWMWVLKPQRRWQRANQSLASERQRERKRLEVEAKVDTSEGVRKERMHSWTSSGKSDKEIASFGVLGIAMI